MAYKITDNQTTAQALLTTHPLRDRSPEKIEPSPPLQVIAFDVFWGKQLMSTTTQAVGLPISPAALQQDAGREDDYSIQGRRSDSTLSYVVAMSWQEPINRACRAALLTDLPLNEGASCLE